MVTCHKSVMVYIHRRYRDGRGPETEYYCRLLLYIIYSCIDSYGNCLVFFHIYTIFISLKSLKCDVRDSSIILNINEKNNKTVYITLYNIGTRKLY